MRLLYIALMLIGTVGSVLTSWRTDQFETWMTLLLCVAVVEVFGLALGIGTLSELVWKFRDTSGGVAGAFGLLAAFIVWMLWHFVWGGR